MRLLIGEHSQLRARREGLEADLGPDLCNDKPARNPTFRT